MSTKDEINLIEELRLKVLALEIYYSDYCTEKSQAAAEPIFETLKNWINQKRELYSQKNLNS